MLTSVAHCITVLILSPPPKMPPRTRIEPNALAPLNEATPARRLWAASLKAGYESRSAFARAIGIRVHTLSMVEAGKAMLSLTNFATACQLVGYTMEEIYFGHATPRKEPPLGHDDIVALCEELGAEPDERAALKVFLDSPEGALQRVTRAYVTAFVTTHAEARRHKTNGEPIYRVAVIAADNARADADALAAGVHPPLSKYQSRRQGGAVRARLAAEKRR